MTNIMTGIQSNRHSSLSSNSMEFKKISALKLRR